MSTTLIVVIVAAMVGVALVVLALSAMIRRRDRIAEVSGANKRSPGYAGRMFDYLTRHPAALRMHLWRQLERPELGPDAADVYSEKMARMTADSAAGQLPSTDLLVLITGLTQSWVLAPRDLLTAADGSRPLPAGTAGRTPGRRRGSRPPPLRTRRESLGRLGVETRLPQQLA